MSWIDTGIIVTYITAMIVVGIASRGKQEDESDYFTGGVGYSRVLGMLIIGLSIGATFFSGISLLAYPSTSYTGGVTIAAVLLTLPIAGVIVSTYFLPVFFAQKVRQPYELIERKFGYPTRAVAAGMYIMQRVAWMGVLIYAPVAAIQAGAGLSEGWFWPLVLLIGISSTLYTTLGGIRGVLVTDAIQFIVMGLGVLGPLLYIAFASDIAWSDGVSYLEDQGKLVWVKLSVDMTESQTLWSILAGVTVANLSMYIADQMSLQRYIASGDLKASRGAFLLNIVGVTLVIGLLIVLGLALFVWYGLAVTDIPPAEADKVFPTFVGTYLPPGIPGLIFAAILAATMSSITSGVNSLAGCLTMDFVGRTQQFQSHESRLRFARWASVCIGLSATFVAGYVHQLGSIFDTAQTLMGVFLGPLLACIVYAISPYRIGGTSMICGMVLGTMSGWGMVALKLSEQWNVSALWVGPISTLVAFLIPAFMLILNLVLFSDPLKESTTEPASADAT